ncbi:hypothetical protein [Sulfuracidifex tepidarius]|uniref:hypothetical protein n=1 Tax=Sulfuracidifex tepidarius TaxID=1294262 RepID=UPI000B11CF50|nr:hypothetical protein [Sulfuracidifex tepidarius]
MNKLTISASMIGTIIEWYDVFIFSSAALYIGEELFPSTNPVVATLNVLLVFALGFITRPIGALIFGHFGDREVGDIHFSILSSFPEYPPEL